MDITRIDSETLAIARLVAESEGISLQQAINDQIELFSL
jgi:hypothetical protein